MTRQVLPYYALAMLLAALAAGVGFKAGRYYPHQDVGFLYFHQPSVTDWLRRPV